MDRIGQARRWRTGRWQPVRTVALVAMGGAAGLLAIGLTPVLAEDDAPPIPEAFSGQTDDPSVMANHMRTGSCPTMTLFGTRLDQACERAVDAEWAR